MNKKFVYGAIVLTFIVAVIALFVSIGSSKQGTFGAITTNLPSMGLTNFAVGPGCDTSFGTCTGSELTFVKKGTCSLIAPNYTSLAASTSLAMDCAVTGVVSGDVVMADFATSSANGAGWLVTQASASSTAGFITLRIVNNTGTTASIPASIASSTGYIIVR